MMQPNNVTTGSGADNGINTNTQNIYIDGTQGKSFFSY
jgi:hypothetical protein